MGLYLSDLAFTRSASADDVIGFVSVTINNDRRLVGIAIFRSASGDLGIRLPPRGDGKGRDSDLMRSVYGRWRRILMKRLFAELRKRGVDVAASGDATAGSRAKSIGVIADPKSGSEGSSPRSSLVTKKVGGGHANA